MPAMRRTIKRLVFEIDVDGELHTYTVPPVDDERGTQLAQILTQTPEQLAKTKLTSRDMFDLAMTAELREQMRSDGVPYNEVFCAGMAALAHFKVLLQDSNPATALDRAEDAARAVWEAGVDPEQLAAYMAAQTLQSMNRSTRRAVASTTRKTAPGTGTTRTKNPKTAPRSRGPRSPQTGP